MSKTDRNDRSSDRHVPAVQITPAKRHYRNIALLQLTSCSIRLWSVTGNPETIAELVLGNANVRCPAALSGRRPGRNIFPKLTLVGQETPTTQNLSKPDCCGLVKNGQTRFCLILFSEVTCGNQAVWEFFTNLARGSVPAVQCAFRAQRNPRAGE
jgi:hypothetical protein